MSIGNFGIRAYHSDGLARIANGLRVGSLTLLCSLAFSVSAATPKQSGISSSHELATAAGHRILAEGGNAFDAAVATAAVLSVVEPESSGLGGGAFFLLHIAKEQREVFIDARETAPAAATRDMYLKPNGEPDRERSINGPLAAAIPGQPAGLVHLAKNYGRLPLRQSLTPAIEIAEKGYAWGEKNVAMIGFKAESLARWPAGKAQFLPNDGKPLKLGQLQRQPDLARTLRALSKGHAGFYEGRTARLLVKGVRANGGIWTLDDLKKYRVVEREPLVGQYGDYRVITSPPPSSGGVALIEMFNILAVFDLPNQSPTQRIHLLTEAMRRAYRDRAIYLGDPDFVQVPIKLLTDPNYAAGLRASIHTQRATPSELLPGVEAPPAGTDTTHFSIIDTEGNLVAGTMSVNLPFGNAFVAPGTGFLLNNEMDDFSMKPGVPNAYGLVGKDANAIAGGKRPLSSMTPSFAIGPSRTAVIGTPGGSRIISMVLIGLLELMEGRSAKEAVSRPRVHHQYLPDVLSAEPGALSDAIQTALKARGHVLSPAERAWGNMHVVVWNHADGSVEAAADPRWKIGRAEVR
jgi:gamma-glutamyltranspeptidase/glutathione hydrolase